MSYLNEQKEAALHIHYTDQYTKRQKFCTVYKRLRNWIYKQFITYYITDIFIKHHQPRSISLFWGVSLEKSVVNLLLYLFLDYHTHKLYTTHLKSIKKKMLFFGHLHGLKGTSGQGGWCLSNRTWFVLCFLIPINGKAETYLKVTVQ